MTHGEKAGALFLEGYNCAQSVVLAFADEMGILKETAARIASSPAAAWDGPEVCGCVSGMAIVAGELLGYSGRRPEAKGRPLCADPGAGGGIPEGKWKHHLQDLLSGITSDTAPVPEARTDDYYKKRPQGPGCLCGRDPGEKAGGEKSTDSRKTVRNKREAAVMTSLPVWERPHGRRFLYGLSREWLNGTVT